MANFPQGGFHGHQQQQGQGQILGNSGAKPLYLCNPFVRSALIKGSFKTIVVLPKYVDQREWVAVNCASSLAAYMP